jgi:hypothetical protein
MPLLLLALMLLLLLAQLRLCGSQTRKETHCPGMNTGH